MLKYKSDDHDFNEDLAVSLKEADWMVTRLAEDLQSTSPGDPRSETLGHALYLWREVLKKLQQGHVIAERPTPPFEFI
jgi:hypothetical protein